MKRWICAVQRLPRSAQVHAFVPSGAVYSAGARPAGEVDEAPFDVGMDQLHADRVADVEAVLAFTTRPSTAGRSMRTQVPFGEAPVTISAN